MKCNLVNAECIYNKNGWCSKYKMQIQSMIKNGYVCMPTNLVGINATGIRVDELPDELFTTPDNLVAPDRVRLNEYLYRTPSERRIKKDTFNFSKALELLKDERRVSRRAWTGTWLHMQVPNSHSYMKAPYIYIERPADPTHTLYPEGYRCPWTPNQLDLLADDWYEVGYEGCTKLMEDINNGTF